MDLIEYDAKDILRRAGLPVPGGATLLRPDDRPGPARDAVLKAQVRAGGRGKAGLVRLVAAGEAETSLDEIRGLLSASGEEPLVMSEERVAVEQECYLGWRIFGSAHRALLVTEASAGRRQPVSRSFWLGLSTQVSNPKTAIVYASVFAAFLPPTFSAVFAAALLCAVFAVETGWYAIVAVVLSSPIPRAAYLSYKAWIDRAAGAVLVGLGLLLVASARNA